MSDLDDGDLLDRAREAEEDSDEQSGKTATTAEEEEGETMFRMRDGMFCSL